MNVLCDHLDYNLGTCFWIFCLPPTVFYESMAQIDILCEFRKDLEIHVPCYFNTWEPQRILTKFISGVYKIFAFSSNVFWRESLLP